MKVEPRVEGVAVIVCCCNSANRLEETLRHLAFQETGSDLNWEIIVVDNNSSDSTVAVARSYWGSFGIPTVSLRIEEEREPGLSHARRKGLMSSRFSVAVFCDDDNWFSKNYVLQAWDLMQRNPQAGIIGGWCEGAFETPPRTQLLPLTSALAIGKPANGSGPVEYAVGAGMVLRMSCYDFMENRGSRALLEDRKGDKPTYGGDVELCWKVRYSGFEILFHESLFFRHFIPASRLRYRYFLWLCLYFVSPFIVTEICRFCVKTPRRSFLRFWYSSIFETLKKTVYYFPRMFLGKHQFYSTIFFLQSWKIAALLMIKMFSFYRNFQIIEQEKRNLSQS